MNTAPNNQDNGEVTNTELARMIAEGFKNTATKDDIAGLRSELSGVTESAKQEVLAHVLVVDERLSTVQHGMGRVIDSLALEKRVDTLEDKVEELAGNRR